MEHRYRLVMHHPMGFTFGTIVETYYPLDYMQMIQLGEAIATGAGCTYSHMEQIHA